jgi:hypothetical protein
VTDNDLTGNYHVRNILSEQNKSLLKIELTKTETQVKIMSMLETGLLNIPFNDEFIPIVDAEDFLDIMEYLNVYSDFSQNYRTIY